MGIPSLSRPNGLLTDGLYQIPLPTEIEFNFSCTTLRVVIPTTRSVVQLSLLLPLKSLFFKNLSVLMLDV